MQIGRSVGLCDGLGGRGWVECRVLRPNCFQLTAMSSHTWPLELALWTYSCVSVWETVGMIVDSGETWSVVFLLPLR